MSNHSRSNRSSSSSGSSGGDSGQRTAFPVVGERTESGGTVRRGQSQWQRRRRRRAHHGKRTAAASATKRSVDPSNVRPSAALLH